MQTVNIAEGARHFSKLISAVESGETIIVMKRDVVVARIIPAEKKGFILGTASGFFPEKLSDIIDRPLDEPDLALWEGRGE